MEHEEASLRDDSLLFSTENGTVRHCACRDVCVLHFLGHWLALSRLQYRDFHERLIEAVRCPLGLRRLEEGGRFAFRTGDGALAFALGRGEMEELLWLLDSARFMLDARDAAAAGFRSAPAPGRGCDKD
jgi:hypothetical protein